jgi:uncharacterized protein YlxW (UPF0749 family)
MSQGSVALYKVEDLEEEVRKMQKDIEVLKAEIRALKNNAHRTEAIEIQAARAALKDQSQ